MTEAMVEVIEVVCPTHGSIYSSDTHEQMPPLPVERLRNKSLVFTCKPCEADGLPLPHVHLLAATEPIDD